MKYRILCIFLLSLAVLAGCGQRTPSTPIQTTPTQAALPPLDVFGAQALLEATITQAQQGGSSGYLLAHEARLTLEVLSCTQQGQSTVAQVRISAPDLYAVLKALEDQVPESPEQMDQELTRLVEQAALTQRQVTVEFYPEAGQWALWVTDELLDACYGGMLTYRAEYYAALEEVPGL